MPFKSAKQRKYLYANKPEVAKKFAMDSAKKGKMLKLKGGGADMGAKDRAQERADRGYGSTAPAEDKSTKQQTANNNSNTGRAGNVNNKTTTVNTSVRKDGPSPKRNFVQNVGYNVKQNAQKLLGFGKKDKTKNLNDLAITTREIGLKNQNTKDAKQRDLDTAKDSKKAFSTNATHKSNRGIDKMLPTFTGLIAKAAKKPLGKNAAKNARFFDDYVLGGKQKGVFTGTKKGSIYSKSGMTQEKFSKLSQDKKMTLKSDYSKKRQAGEIDAYGRPITQGEGNSKVLLPIKKKPIVASTIKKVVKPDQSKSFFGGFRAYKKGKMINTQNKVNGVITGLKKASKLHAGQAKTLSKLKLNKGGGVRYGPPPLRGPNPQVPPVKFARGGGAAIRGTKFTGTF